MKIIWEAKDIRAGRVAWRCPNSEAWMVSWLSWMGKNSGERFTLVSLNEGMNLRTFATKDEVAAYMTEQELLPIELEEFAGVRKLL